jgi:hypothetical protein
MSESVILCEGYHDRAFWKGWLVHRGCTDLGGQAQILDPWGDPVRGGGQHAYHSRQGQFIRVVPCGGKSKVLRVAGYRLAQRATKALLRLVINVDSDMTASGTSAGATGLRRPDVEQMVRAFDPAAAINPDGEIEVEGGATKVSLIRWEVNDPPARGLPDQQTLERLVSAALAAAYPGRATALQDWLDSRPGPPPADPKDHAWSYMAGWYAEQGCEFFYSNLWRDPGVVNHLESRLRSSGAWQIGETLAG